MNLVIKGIFSCLWTEKSSKLNLKIIEFMIFMLVNQKLKYKEITIIC